MDRASRNLRLIDCGEPEAAPRRTADRWGVAAGVRGEGDADGRGAVLLREQPATAATAARAARRAGAASVAMVQVLLGHERVVRVSRGRGAGQGPVGRAEEKKGALNVKKCNVR